VCSTFDSAPHVGSIGRALDIGATVFKQSCVPVVVGAPQLKRWTAFGNLFADFRGERFRIDRHPVMSRHPVTPMDEADLRLHLARQSDRTVGLVDCVALGQPGADEAVDVALARAGAVLLDVVDAQTQAQVGRQLWREHRFEPPGGTGPIAVVSGSCSPTTSRQIRFALDNGFTGLALDAARLSSDGAARDCEIERAIRAGHDILKEGHSPLLYSALEGETDMAGDGGGHLLGRALGTILGRLVSQAGLRRSIVAGGDTSSHAIAALDIAALECRMPIPGAPGSPLCTAHPKSSSLASFEIAFKGGQVGADDYFVLLRDL
jgi:3-oxoisoapionate kinase